MIRKRYRVVLLAFALLAGGVVVFLLIKPDPAQKKLDRLRLGMMRAEVHDVLTAEPKAFDIIGYDEAELWVVQEGVGISVTYDENGRLNNKRLVREPRWPLDLLRRWLHL